MSGLARETRLQIMLSDEELAAIDDWRFEQRMPSRASAIRRLINIGLHAGDPSSADPAMRSQDFGILNQKDAATGQADDE